MEQFDSRTHIRTSFPGTTSTIENDFTVLRYFFYCTLERLKSGQSRCGSPKTGAGYVTSGIQWHKSSEDKERFRRSFIANFDDQLLGPYYFGTLPLSHWVRLRPLDAKSKKARQENKEDTYRNSHSF